jgi:hypothetical protein
MSEQKTLEKIGLSDNTLIHLDDAISLLKISGFRVESITQHEQYQDITRLHILVDFRPMTGYHYMKSAILSLKNNVIPVSHVITLIRSTWYGIGEMFGNQQPKEYSKPDHAQES